MFSSEFCKNYFAEHQRMVASGSVNISAKSFVFFASIIFDFWLVYLKVSLCSNMILVLTIVISKRSVFFAFPNLKPFSSLETGAYYSK